MYVKVYLGYTGRAEVGGLAQSPSTMLWTLTQ